MSRVCAWALAAAALVLATVGVVLAVWGHRHGLDLPAGRGSEITLGIGTAVAAVPFAVVGLLVARRARANAVGWIFLGIGVTFGLVSVAHGYADLALYGDKGWPGAVWVAWLASWLVIVPAFEAPCLVAQLFPDGRPVPGRFRRLFRLSIVAAFYLVLPALLGPGPLSSYPTTDNPTDLPRWVGSVLFDPVWALAIFGLFTISLASIVTRFRCSRGIERQQLTWLAVTAGFTIVCLVPAFVLSDASTAASTAFFVLAIVGLGATPVAVGVAILRYRLYEIDRIVSRTLVYAVLTVILGAAYVGLVLAGQALFSSFAGGSNLAIAVSTLVVAALFLPLRSRVQRVVDRRFNRRRYDAQRTLEQFGTRLREQVELSALSAELRAVISETMQPASVSVWRHERVER